LSHDPSPAAEPGRLYLITAARPDLAAFLEAAVGGGVDLVQIRDPAGALLALADDATLGLRCRRAWS
jgi:thiamine monophosphate synthase